MIAKDLPINHTILVWARKEANLSLARAASKAGIKDLKARGDKETLPSVVRLERWEEGAETPTFAQLENLAKAYRRPVLTFFLPRPPLKATRLKDFRTVANVAVDSEAFSSEFSALLRRIEALGVSLHDLTRQSGAKPLPFVGTANTRMRPDQLVQNIRSILDYSLDAQKKAGESDRVFSDIRTKAEERGIFVLLEGNLGSWHTDIEPDVFRGVSISDEFAPLIVVNPTDAKTARVFTLAHELCHIWLGDSGVSNWTSLDIRTKSNLDNELFCDQVAAELLVPRDDLMKEWTHVRFGNLDTKIDFVSKIFGVSTIVIARRILDLGYIDTAYYWSYYNERKLEWDNFKKALRQKKGQPSYRIRTRARLGNRVISTVMTAAREGRISELDASRMLSVKINHFAEIT